MSEPSFESDFPKALDSLSSFPEEKSLKAEETLVIEKVNRTLDFMNLPSISPQSNLSVDAFSGRFTNMLI